MAYVAVGVASVNRAGIAVADCGQVTGRALSDSGELQGVVNGGKE